jgi:hypothetical protein
LVPFCGSGSEAIGALLGGFAQVVGIDLSQDYLDIAGQRLAHHCGGARPTALSSPVSPEEPRGQRGAVMEQMSLF